MSLTAVKPLQLFGVYQSERAQRKKKYGLVMNGSILKTEKVGEDLAAINENLRKSDSACLISRGCLEVFLFAVAPIKLHLCAAKWQITPFPPLLLTADNSMPPSTKARTPKANRLTVYLFYRRWYCVKGHGQ